VVFVECRTIRRLATITPVGLVCGASALVIVVLGTRLSFVNDDWYVLLWRPGLGAGFVQSGRAARLAVPRDRLDLPWRLALPRGPAIDLCRL
jgi:hypothetical protein